MPHILFTVFGVFLSSQLLLAKEGPFSSDIQRATGVNPAELTVTCIIGAVLFIGIFLWIIYIALRVNKISIFEVKESEGVSWGVRSVILLLAFYLSLSISMQLFIFAFLPRFDVFKDLLKDTRAQTVLPLLITLATDIGAAIFIFMVLRCFNEDLTKLGIRSEKPKKNALLGIGAEFMAFPFFLLAGAIVTLIAHFFEKTPPPQEAVKIFMALRKQPGILLFIYILLVILVIPVFEELIFRAFIQNGLRKYMGMWGAIITASLIFATMHWNVYSLLPILFLSLFLGYVFEKTRNILTSISLHCLHNTLIVGMALLIPEGGF